MKTLELCTILEDLDDIHFEGADPSLSELRSFYLLMFAEAFKSVESSHPAALDKVRRLIQKEIKNVKEARTKLSKQAA